MVQNKIPFKKFWPGIAWFLFTGVLVFLPGSDIPESNWLDMIYFDKFVHAGIFGGLTLLFCLPFFKAHFSLQEKINYFIKIGLAAVLWGITVEVIQRFFIPGRSFDMFDWAADSAGVYIGFLMSKKIIKYLASKKVAEVQK
jgi:hypothetical protein